MPQVSEPIYCSQQIIIPPTLPHILKVYAKAAIKTQPYDLLTWSAAYFRAMADGKIPPMKFRLEYPLVRTDGGLTAGYLRVIIKQFSGDNEIERVVLQERWHGICLKDNELRQILCTAGVYKDVQFALYKFVAVAAGFLCKSLTQTMIMLCELFSEEPEGGSSAISADFFVDVYTFLAAIDASKKFKYIDGIREGTIQKVTVIDNPEVTENKTSIPNDVTNVMTPNMTWLTRKRVSYNMSNLDNLEMNAILDDMIPVNHPKISRNVTSSSLFPRDTLVSRLDNLPASSESTFSSLSCVQVCSDVCNDTEVIDDELPLPEISSEVSSKTLGADVNVENEKEKSIIIDECADESTETVHAENDENDENEKEKSIIIDKCADESTETAHAENDVNDENEKEKSIIIDECADEITETVRAENDESDENEKEKSIIIDECANELTETVHGENDVSGDVNDEGKNEDGEGLDAPEDDPGDGATTEKKTIRVVTLAVFSEEGVNIDSLSAMSIREKEGNIPQLYDENGEPITPTRTDITVKEMEAVIEQLQRNKDEKVKDLEATMDSLENLVEQTKMMTTEVDNLSSRRLLRPTSKEFTETEKNNELSNMNEQNNIFTFGIQKIPVDPDAKGVVNPIFKGLFDNVADKMGVIKTTQEVVDERQPEVIIVNGIPGIGPVVDEEIVEEFLKYIRETAAEQCDMFMPRDIRHCFCPPLEKI